MKFLIGFAFSALLLLTPFSASAQEQGNCNWFVKINPTLTQYLKDHSAKCWYGTFNSDTLKVSDKNEVTLNGKVIGVYGPNLNIFLGFGGNDILSGRDKLDWIYGGPGHDTIYVTTTSVVRGGLDADTFYSASMDKTFIQKHILDNDFQKGDLIYSLYPQPENQQSNNSSSDCPCELETVYVDGEGIINDYETTRCPCRKIEIGSDEWVSSQGWDPMRH